MPLRTMQRVARHGRIRVATACVLFALGCETTPDGAPALPDAGNHLDGGQDASSVVLEPSGCDTKDGVTTTPHTVADVVALLNALTRPVSIPCFVAALPRPLALHAIDSRFSAQPAEGARSPRVFLFFEGLTLSVVPAGPSARLLEFGEARPGDRSLKAELEFPIDAELDEGAPYERLPFDDNITTCGFCHQGETQDPTIASPHAIISPALRPMPYQRVPLSDLRAEAVACKPEAEPERCALLRALFSGADAVEHDFPPTYATFF